MRLTTGFSGRLLHPLAQPAVGRDTARQCDAAAVFFASRPQQLVNQHVHHGLLETGGNVF